MLPVVILLALKRFEIEEISYWWLSSCVSWTCIQGVVEDRGVAIAWTFLMGLWLGSSNVEKCGDHWRKKFFINNPVEALIPFKEKHQGLLKLHVPLGWDWGIPAIYWNLVYLLEGVWRVLMKKKGEATERRGSIVKSREILFEGGLWKSFWALHVWWSHGKCLYQMVGPSWEVSLTGIAVHTGCR